MESTISMLDTMSLFISTKWIQLEINHIMMIRLIFLYETSLQKLRTVGQCKFNVYFALLPNLPHLHIPRTLATTHCQQCPHLGRSHRSLHHDAFINIHEARRGWSSVFSRQDVCTCRAQCCPLAGSVCTRTHLIRAAWRRSLPSRSASSGAEKEE